MTRPLRLEFPGAIYHVTARGNARSAIYFDDEDRNTFLTALAECVARFGWLCHRTQQGSGLDIMHFGFTLPP